MGSAPATGPEARCAALRLHAARHTFASLALAAGRSIRWVAEQLGHANPELTLRVYAHVIPVDDQDLAFVDFSGGPGRPYTAPASATVPPNENAPGTTARRRSGFLERETGFEPATLSLGTPYDTSQCVSACSNSGGLDRFAFAFCLPLSLPVAVSWQ
ncbi:MAG: tyrosine-type recombinase/integrase [Myxococcota bacterium]|nr:tyrosine-type recombinase/integrase [Myxococcota bacterium]